MSSGLSGSLSNSARYGRDRAGRLHELTADGGRRYALPYVRPGFSSEVVWTTWRAPGPGVQSSTDLRSALSGRICDQVATAAGQFTRPSQVIFVIVPAGCSAITDG